MTTQKLFSNITYVFSSVCLLHCLAVPFIILLMPAIALLFSELIETLLIVSIIPISAIGFAPTWFRHKNYRLLRIYLLSLLTLVGGHFLFHSEHLSSGLTLNAQLFGQLTLTLIGAIGLAYAVYKNNKHTHVCSNPHHDHNHEPHLH